MKIVSARKADSTGLAPTAREENRHGVADIEKDRAAAIRAMHPADLKISRDKLARFLCGWLGGPKRYNEKYGEIHIPRAHAHFRIGRDERDAGLVCIEKAIALQPYAEDFREYLLRELRVPAGRIFDTSQDPL